MATIESIAARRDIALARIAKALKVEFIQVRGSAEDRHAGELEQIADKVDPANAPPPVDPESSRMRAREGPPPSHEEVMADLEARQAAMTPAVAEPTEVMDTLLGDAPRKRIDIINPSPETSDERKEPRGTDRPDGEPVQGGGRPAPAARGDRQQHPRPR
jgi:hypothetical protein